MPRFGGAFRDASPGQHSWTQIETSDPRMLARGEICSRSDRDPLPASLAGIKNASLRPPSYPLVSSHVVQNWNSSHQVVLTAMGAVRATNANTDEDELKVEIWSDV